MSNYCNGSCIYLNEQKKKCDKHNVKLAYCRHKGSISYTVFEKDKECIKNNSEECEDNE